MLDCESQIFDANQEKAIKNMSLLAFNEFRWENGLSFQQLTKSEINDYHRLITRCLEEYEEEHPGIQYLADNRAAIVKEIGRDQNRENPRLKKQFIKEAIEKAMNILSKPVIATHYS